MRGFTLVEMLVVLVIIGLSSAVVIPHLPSMGASFEFALNRQSFEQAIAALGYRSFQDSQDLVLSGTYTDQGRIDDSTSNSDPGDTIDGKNRALSAVPTDRIEIPPVNTAFAIPALPAGWELTVPTPIYFRSSGYCSGGQIVLRIGRREYAYLLRAPLCLAQLIE